MIFFLALVILMGLVSGCGETLEFLLLDNISEVQECVFVGSSKGIKATFVVGFREEEYLKNGISTNSIPFAILTVASEEKSALNVDNFELIIGNNKYLGVLAKNPYTGENQADLGDVACGDSAVVSFALGEEQIDIALLPISNSLNYGAYDAIRVVAENKKEKFEPYVSKNTLGGEVYIKLFGELKRNNKDLSWGITIVTKSGKRLNFVVSADTGELLLCS